jgi:hypothetical protein
MVGHSIRAKWPDRFSAASLRDPTERATEAARFGATAAHRIWLSASICRRCSTVAGESPRKTAVRGITTAIARTLQKNLPVGLGQLRPRRVRFGFESSAWCEVFESFHLAYVPGQVLIEFDSGADSAGVLPLFDDRVHRARVAGADGDGTGHADRGTDPEGDPARGHRDRGIDRQPRKKVGTTDPTLVGLC